MRLTLGELSSGSLRFGVNVGTLLQELTQALPTLSPRGLARLCRLIPIQLHSFLFSRIRDSIASESARPPSATYLRRSRPRFRLGSAGAAASLISLLYAKLQTSAGL